jgi:hypothetical protein
MNYVMNVCPFAARIYLGRLFTGSTESMCNSRTNIHGDYVASVTSVFRISTRLSNRLLAQPQSTFSLFLFDVPSAISGEGPRATANIGSVADHQSIVPSNAPFGTETFDTGAGAGVQLPFPLPTRSKLRHRFNTYSDPSAPWMESMIRDTGVHLNGRWSLSSPVVSPLRPC